MRCRGLLCDKASKVVDDANCTYVGSAEGEGQNWTCIIVMKPEFKVLNYRVDCHEKQLDDIICIERDCCTLYFDVELLSSWYKSW
ncbi:hypothetical protein BIW11_12769, partial [Tropilaelaps mercedesae]